MEKQNQLVWQELSETETENLWLTSRGKYAEIKELVFRQMEAFRGTGKGFSFGLPKNGSGDIRKDRQAILFAVNAMIKKSKEPYHCFWASSKSLFVVRPITVAENIKIHSPYKQYDVTPKPEEREWLEKCLTETCSALSIGRTKENLDACKIVNCCVGLDPKRSVRKCVIGAFFGKSYAYPYMFWRTKNKRLIQIAKEVLKKMEGK